MNFAEAMQVAASGMSAQRLRLNLISSNLANANTTQSEMGGPYRRKDPSFRSEHVGDDFNRMLTEMQENHIQGVNVDRVVTSDKFRQVYDPKHPDANADGYVSMPDVNPVEEMVDMLQSTRSYEANVQAIKALKSMATQALGIGG